MSDYGPRTYVRDANGPRVVSTSRYARDSEDRGYSSRSRRSSDKKSKSKHDTSKHSTSRISERPVFRLDIISQPTKSIALGMEVSTSVLVSLAFSNPDAVTTDINLDRSRLVGMVSVAAETRNGERVPMEADTIVAEQLVDSLRPIPQEHADRIARAHPCRLPLGFLSFSDLLIRQAGSFRVRVSLLHVPGNGHGPVNIATMDSEVVKVARPSLQQRRYRS